MSVVYGGIRYLALALTSSLVVSGCAPQNRAHDAGTVTQEDASNEACGRCSEDGRGIVGCDGEAIERCDSALVCDPTSVTCVADPCVAAEINKSSVGCDYYATDMDTFRPGHCFAAFIANTGTTPAKIEVEHRGQPLPVAQFARIPSGTGPSLSYAPYDPNVGVPPGEVAILFLSGEPDFSSVRCPVPPAVASGGATGTTISDAFHITTDVPVVAYQINPYGGGAVAITAGSLLIPTSAWDTEYIAVNVSPRGVAQGEPSLNIVAREDATHVTLVPTAAVVGAGGIPSGAAGAPLTFTLDRGQQAQISQAAELTGSTVTADKPIGFMAGQRCMNMPSGVAACDHGEQMIPPVKALGHRHVGVMYRPRWPVETSTFWRLVGAVDGTQLTWSTDVGGPTTLGRGESVIFETGTPFTVQSQDEDHPFLLFTYMTGGSMHEPLGYGDADFVLSVPPEQYLRQYVFFADPTYPETNLVVVRSRVNGQFSDVILDCAGPLTGWEPVGPDFEYTRVDLATGLFEGVGTCSTGRHEITSGAPFGLWVWGWGSPLTDSIAHSAYVSYGYPAGMNVTPINDVILRQP